MIRRANENVSFIKAVPDNKGQAGHVQILNDGEFCGKGRLFNKITLTPGASVAGHRHEGEFEVYYLLSGSGVYTDNDKEIQVGPGDVMICPDGGYHALVNTGDKDLVFIALILFCN